MVLPDNTAQDSKWHAVIRSVADAIILIDQTGTIREANPATMQLFKYDLAEMIGHNVSMLMPEPYHSEHDGYLQRYSETGQKRIIGIGREVTARRKDGGIFPVLLSVSEAHYDNDRLFVGIVRDLSEIKTNEKRLTQAHKAEATAQLTAGIAHDFNNLLTIIQGNLEMLESHVADQDGQEMLGELLGAIEDGSTLVKQLLAFGRRQTLHPEPSNINMLIRQLLRLMQRTISEAIEIKPILLPSLPNVRVDPGQLENALMNLILNARDAMPAGGRIEVKTGIAETADLSRTSLRPAPNGYARISVRDNGTGMPDGVLSLALDPFFTTKGPSRGSGLGLSMVQGFIKQSGGDIVIQSTEGQGTEVSLFLPALSGNVAARQPTAHPEARIQGSGLETILLVEDDARVRVVNIRRLTSLGYRVLEATDGPSALDIIGKTSGIALLFSDIVMPGGMSGSELARQAVTRRPGIKILLTTGYSDDLVDQQTGHFAVLQKPYSGDLLANRIRALLND